MTTNATQAIADRAIAHGVSFTGEIVGPEYHDTVNRDRTYTLAELAQAKGRISRLRLLTDPGCPFFDVSYCHGILPDGTIVPIYLRYPQFSRGDLKGQLIQWAKDEGVYAKGIGLLDQSNWAILYG